MGDTVMITLQKAHCSGHASGADIERMVKRVKPDLLIPIHTLAAERFKDFSEARIVGRGESFKC
jgi:mRNA degradation ribonuclease J1/J2